MPDCLEACHTVSKESAVCLLPGRRLWVQSSSSSVLWASTPKIQHPDFTLVALGSPQAALAPSPLCRQGNGGTGGTGCQTGRPGLTQEGRGGAAAPAPHEVPALRGRCWQSLARQGVYGPGTAPASSQAPQAAPSRAAPCEKTSPSKARTAAAQELPLLIFTALLFSVNKRVYLIQHYY